MGFLSALSMQRKSLKYKLVIAFSLMSVIPLLVIGYFVTTYIMPNIDSFVEISLIVLITLWVSLLGYLLIRQIISPIIDLSLETKLIAEGQFSSEIQVQSEDELGDIATAVNSMTGKIRGYIGELQDYSKKTALLNMQIHKKVITLTNLMQLGDLISSGAAFEKVMNFSADKLSEEIDD
ncbi:MAG: HAMP domain-containing protein, partial [Candidatus Omnitrophota bacterium]